MARMMATTTTVDLDRLLDFVRPRHHALLITRRSDGAPQASVVLGDSSEIDTDPVPLAFNGSTNAWQFINGLTVS